jgi:hypothetical protein
MLALGFSAAAAAQDVEAFRYAGQTVPLSELDEQTVSKLGVCDGFKATRDDNTKTVFERADAAREYEACLTRTLALMRATPDIARNAAAANAVQNLQVAVVADSTSNRQTLEAAEDFMGLTWGLGFGYSFASDDLIEDAVVVNGVVRSTKDVSEKARVVFEYHRYFWCNKDKEDKRVQLLDKGCGPFVGVAATKEDVLSGVAMGFMWGWKSPDKKENDGFSIGVGFVLDNDIKSLADGFSDGLPLPVGETAPRYETESRWSTLLFVTRTF